jgi:hypothetical protein
MRISLIFIGVILYTLVSTSVQAQPPQASSPQGSASSTTQQGKSKKLSFDNPFSMSYYQYDRFSKFSQGFHIEKHERQGIGPERLFLIIHGARHGVTWTKVNKQDTPCL